MQPFAHALEKVKDICVQLKQRFPSFRYLDIGGGIGIKYRVGQQELLPELYARTVVPFLRKMGLAVVMEPGRFLVGNGGILVCRVQYIKNNAYKKFVVTDAAMNDLIRPSLYDAHHEIVAVEKTSDMIHGDLVGPICESGDFIAKDRNLPAIGQDGLLAVQSAGAYGFSMSSNYNSRTRAAEVMVDGSKAFLIRKRETLDDLVKGEILPVARRRGSKK